MDKIAILLATYNGEEYIAQQIDSLLSQTNSEWTLYVHDDGSTDGTMDIIKAYAAKHDNIRILQYPPQGGAKNNFLSLLRYVEAEYYLFCDQDDVWDKMKIEAQMSEMKKLERIHGDKPLLVFTDLRVVDSGLREISPSMWKDGGVRPELLTSFDSGAVFEFVTGCTMLFNYKAKECVSLQASKALMHDSWTTYCILKAGGTVAGINQPLVNYRQHGDNTLGATTWASHGLLFKLSHIVNILRRNYRHWKSLEELNYGSFCKYMKYKYYYRRKTNGK